MSGKKFVIFLLLLVGFCSLSFSDVFLTDLQMETIDKALETAKKELETSSKLLTESNRLLTESNQDLTTSNTTITQLKEEITRLKSLILTLRTTIATLEIALNSLNKSYEMRKTDQIINDLKWFVAGGVAGFIWGGYEGIKIGITISL